MNVATASPEPETAPDQRVEDRQYYRHLLHDLLALGARVGRMIERQTETDETAHTEPARQEERPAARPVNVKDTAIAYDRLSRAMRRSMMLADKFGEPVGQSAATQGKRQRIAARKRIIREVEDAIQRTTEDEEADELHDELLDRLDSPELEEELGDRPIPEIIAEICRDLGLAHPPGSHPWKRRTPADVAELCARAARPAGRGARPPVPVWPAPMAAPDGPGADEPGDTGAAAAQARAAQRSRTGGGSPPDPAGPGEPPGGPAGADGWPSAAAAAGGAPPGTAHPGGTPPDPSPPGEAAAPRGAPGETADPGGEPGEPAALSGAPPRPAWPSAAWPGEAGPNAARSEPARSEPAWPSAARSGPARSEPAGPSAARSEPARSEPVVPEPALRKPAWPGGRPRGGTPPFDAAADPPQYPDPAQYEGRPLYPVGFRPAPAWRRSPVDSG